MLVLRTLYNFLQLMKIACIFLLCFFVIGCTGYIAGAPLASAVSYFVSNAATVVAATSVLALAISLLGVVI